LVLGEEYCGVGVVAEAKTDAACARAICGLDPLATRLASLTQTFFLPAGTVFSPMSAKWAREGGETGASTEGEGKRGAEEDTGASTHKRDDDYSLPYTAADSHAETDANHAQTHAQTQAHTRTRSHSKDRGSDDELEQKSLVSQLLAPIQEPLPTGVWLVIEDSAGKAHTNARALTQLTRISPLLWPFLLSVRLFGEERLVYAGNFIFAFWNPEFEATPPETYLMQLNRKRTFSRRPHLLVEAVKLSVQWAGFLAANAFIAYSIYLVLSWNCSNIGWYSCSIREQHKPWLWKLQLEQYWGVFAPRPPDSWWWYNIHGKLVNGTEVELFDKAALFTHEPKPHSWDKPDPYYMVYNFKNHRWFKFYEMAFNSGTQIYRLNYGKWVCREFNAVHHRDTQLKSFSMYLVSERLDYSKDDGSRLPAGKWSQWEHNCL